MSEPHEPAREAYVAETSLSEGGRIRLLDHARRALDARPRRRGGWGLVGLAGAMAVVVWLLARPSPGDHPAGLPIDHVTLALQGEGVVGGTQRAPVISWQDGTLGVSVEPGQGVELTVRTDEALVEVVGTVFDVFREHHATDVTVFRGTVRVTCVGAEPVLVSAPSEVRCLPDALAPLLLRASELAQVAAGADERLPTLDRADGLARPGSAAAGELLAHRAKALADGDHADAALEHAERYLQAGYTARRHELLAYVARTRFERAGCAAREALEPAVAELPPGPEALMLARCLLETDPERARALARAAQQGPAVQASATWQAVAARILERVSGPP